MPARKFCSELDTEFQNSMFLYTRRFFETLFVASRSSLAYASDRFSSENETGCSLFGACARSGAKFEQPKPPEPRFKLYGWVEAGITVPFKHPIDNHVFGQLWNDRSYEPLLNQLSVV